MGISVRHTWMAIVAAAGLCTSAAAQSDGYGSDLDEHVAVDVAAAAALDDTAPYDAAFVDESAEFDAPTDNAERIVVTPYVAARAVAAQYDFEDIDDPPITGDVEEILADGPGGASGDRFVVESGNVHDDWVYEDDSSFAWLISSGTWLHRGRWFAQTEATLVNRSTAPKQILTDISFNVPNFGDIFSEAMTTETAGFGYEPGLRVTIGKYLGRDAQNRDRTLEFTFWGLNDWTAQHAVTNSLGNLRTPLDRGIGGFNFATQHEYEYNSELNSFEMNAKTSRRLGRDRMVLKPDGHWERQCDPGRTPTFLAGFRAMTVDEDFLFASVGAPFVDANNMTIERGGRYEIDAQNRLFGVQLGAEMIQQHCNWSFGVRGKLGGYANFVEQHSVVDIDDQFFGSVSRDERASDVQMAMAAELGLVGTYQIRPNLALRCAYDFIYLQGLALAPQQLDFNAAPVPNVRSGSHIYLNGGSIGLEYVW